MDGIEFYAAAVGILPLFLLTIVFQTRFTTELASWLMEGEEARLVLSAAGRKEFALTPEAERVTGLTAAELRDSQRTWKERARTERQLRIISGVMYAPPVLAFVAIFASLGAIFAGGAPWFVSLLVWPGLISTGLLLLMLLITAIEDRTYFIGEAAQERLERAGAIPAVSESIREILKKGEERHRLDRERAEALREVMQRKQGQ